jgi:heme o synthase
VAAGVLALWATAGGLPALFAILGAAYYVLVYTLLLKPRIALSSVPGALAGVFPALIGWAATGTPWSGDVLFLCTVVFIWSPPHFWALSLARQDDYRASGIPTPAINYGERTTRMLIVAFFAALTGVVTAAVVTGAFGLPYVAIALAANLVLWLFVARLLAARSSAAAWALFKVSGPCLAAIVAAAVVGRLL